MKIQEGLDSEKELATSIEDLQQEKEQLVSSKDDLSAQLQELDVKLKSSEDRVIVISKGKLRVLQ